MNFENKFYKKDNTYYITDDAYVFSAEVDDGAEFPEHQHKFVELVYMVKGKGVQVIDGREYPVSKGDLVMINYNQKHAFKVSSSSAYINILMKTEYISQNLKNRENAFALLNLSEFEGFKKSLDEAKRKVTFSGEDRLFFEKLTFELINEMGRESAGYRLAVRSLFNLVLITVFRKMSLKMERAFTGISGELLQYISVNCGEKLTLESVARMCNYNTSYFSRLFKEYTGKSFTEYLKDERIKKAKQLLETTEFKVSEIFLRILKRWQGLRLCNIKK